MGRTGHGKGEGRPHKVRVAAVEQHVHRDRLLQTQDCPGQRGAMAPAESRPRGPQRAVSTTRACARVWSAHRPGTVSDVGFAPARKTAEACSAFIYYRLVTSVQESPNFRSSKQRQMFKRIAKQPGTASWRQQGCISPRAIVRNEQVVPPRLRLEPAAAVGRYPISVSALGPHKSALHRCFAVSLLLMLAYGRTWQSVITLHRGAAR